MCTYFDGRHQATLDDNINLCGASFIVTFNFGLVVLSGKQRSQKFSCRYTLNQFHNQCGTIYLHLFYNFMFVLFNCSHQQHWNVQRSLTQLVSTSNKRSSSGEMKKDLKRVGIYGGTGLDTCFDQRWTVKVNLHTFISGCGRDRS